MLNELENANKLIEEAKIEIYYKNEQLEKNQKKLEELIEQ